LEIETGIPLIDIAAALASLSHGNLLLPVKPAASAAEAPERPRPHATRPDRAVPSPPDRAVPSPPARAIPPSPARAVPPPEARVRPSERAALERSREPQRPSAAKPRPEAMSSGAPRVPPVRVEGPAGGRKSGRAEMETFRLEVGSTHGIKPGNIVGAIAGESGIDGVHIGRVDIREEFSFVDLPQGMPPAIFKSLQKLRVAGRELRLSRVASKPPKPRKMLSRR
jgi:ATP-dependent RNA helicase DeaD